MNIVFIMGVASVVLFILGYLGLEWRRVYPYTRFCRRSSRSGRLP